jgi:hypothetical protein
VLTFTQLLYSNRTRLFFLTNSELLGTWPLTIRTSNDKNGFSLGRAQTLRARSNAQCRGWKKAIELAAHKKQHAMRYHRVGGMRAAAMRLHLAACAVNQSSLFVFFIYLTIIASFVKSLIHFEIAPNGSLWDAHPAHGRLQVGSRVKLNMDSIVKMDTDFTQLPCSVLRAS